MNLTGNLLPGQKLTGRIKSLTVLTISAYGIAVKNGYKGTEEEWLTYLSAYGIACKNGFVGTEEEWLASLEANPERIKGFVEDYLKENPTQVDTTLTTEGMAADAKATGDAIEALRSNSENHANNSENPHSVTKTQVGLGNVDNTSDMDKPVSTAQATAIEAAKNSAIAVANAKATTETLKGTLLADGWSGTAPFTQTVTIVGLHSTDYPFVDIDLSNVTDNQSVIEAWNMVGRMTVSADNTIIGYCYDEKPTVDIPIVFKVVR